MKSPHTFTHLKLRPLSEKGRKTRRWAKGKSTLNSHFLEGVNTWIRKSYHSLIIEINEHYVVDDTMLLDACIWREWWDITYSSQCLPKVLELSQGYFLF